MSWFWPFRKSTEKDLPVLVDPVNSASTPKPVGTPRVAFLEPVVSEPLASVPAGSVPSFLQRSCVNQVCGVPHVCCAPVAFSFCLPCRALWPLAVPVVENSELLSTPPLEIRSVPVAAPVAVPVAAPVPEPLCDVEHVKEPATQALTPDVPQSPPQPPAEI